MAEPFSWIQVPSLLLHPPIPVSLHGICPRTIMGRQWWDNERKQAYASTAYHCQACGVWKHKAKYRKWLEAHEVYNIDYERRISTYVCTVPLCHLCHNYIHLNRLRALLAQGEVSHKKFRDVVEHGLFVLDKYVPEHKQYTDSLYGHVLSLPSENGQWKLKLFGEYYKGN